MSDSVTDDVDPTLALPADRQDERLVGDDGLKGVLASTWDRVKGGELGSLPVVAGLVIIAVVFFALEPRFLSSYNLVSIVLFAAPVGIISLGIVLVLLLGEIDLSVGSLSGFASAVLAVLLVRGEQPLIVAILAAVAVGSAIGLVFGLLRTRVGVPSFVFSLAGLLAFQGALFYTLGDNATTPLPNDSALVQFAKFGYIDPWLSYVVVGAIAVLFALGQLTTQRRRAAAGLSVGWPPLVWIKTAALGGGLAYLTYYLNIDRGWPKVWVLFAFLVVLVDLVLRKTAWGRHVYAVGGSEEAARRSGIKVDRVYVSVFVACSTFAAVGGVMAAGVLGSVSRNSGTNGLELTAIAAAVIGGASLFGGRGTAYAAMLGIVVLQAIESGLNQVNVDSSVRFMVTGGVLLLAVTIDSISRKARTASGRA